MADSPFIVEVTRDNFQQIMETSSKVPVLLDFWASWCQPCLVLMPILAKLAEEYDGKFLLGKLNTEEEQEIAASYGIRSIPTVKLFRNGQPVDEFMGALPEQAIRQFLDRYVARESDSQIELARERLLAGDAEGAVAILKEAHQGDPDNPRVVLALAEAIAATGDIDAAEHTLNSLPMAEQETPDVVMLRNRLFFDEQLVGAPPISELEAAVAAEPQNPEPLYRLALRKVMNREYEAAMELLLQVMQKDRNFGDEAGRRALVKVFELLGDDPRVHQYRRRMASLMF